MAATRTAVATTTAIAATAATTVVTTTATVATAVTTAGPCPGATTPITRIADTGPARSSCRATSVRRSLPSCRTVPYYYRPSIGIGIYYGYGGYYPYGYTPRGYYDPIPGRPYGGLRITGFSRDAQVFADGYYVGIVNDFDGIFQAVNLEAGPHRIQIVEYGREAVEFDVMIQPGRTMTFRGDGYRY